MSSSVLISVSTLPPPPAIPGPPGTNTALVAKTGSVHYNEKWGDSLRHKELRTRGMMDEAGPILVVDHDDGVRVLVSSLLESAGFGTAEAETGEIALALARAV